MICGHLNRWAVLCSSVLHRGQRAVGCELGSILCLYVIRSEDFPVRICANERLILRGRDSSDLSIVGACWFRILFGCLSWI